MRRTSADVVLSANPCVDLDRDLLAEDVVGSGFGR